MVSIVSGVMCAFCYLFGVWVGRNKLKSNADQRIQDVESVEPMQASDIVVRSNLEPFRVADTPQTDLLVKTPRKSRESHEKNCETCRDKDAYDDWQGNCDECENGSMYTPQTDAEIPKNALRSDCTECRFVGTYDTEFPCANCVRKNKDYYSAMQTERCE